MVTGPNLTTTPELTSYVDQRFFVAPLGGPQNPINYLDRFPEEVYNKAIDSHLVKFMYALLGPAGAGWLRQNYLEARLLFEDHGLNLFDLDKFYGNPLAFGRILEEVYDEDPTGILPRDKWEQIRAKDAKYRNRAVDYVQGIRMGNTPAGMHLIARSGLGHEVEIVEHYKWIYDQLSDDPLGLFRYGRTDSTEEMVVLPRRETSRSEMVTITITGEPTGGDFTLQYEDKVTTPIDFDAPADDVRAALEALSTIGSGQIEVSGGPGPDAPYQILFTGRLAARDIPQLRAYPNFPEAAAAIYVTTDTGGVEAIDEIVHIADQDLRYLQSALDRIKPMTTIPTMASGRGLRSRQLWNSTMASSVFTEVVRYVTGSVGVIWPTRDEVYWIETGVERESRQPHDSFTHHYYGLHNVASVTPYTDAAIADPDYLSDLAVVDGYRSEHLGPFGEAQRFLFGHLRDNSEAKRVGAMALADRPEPLTITGTAEHRSQNKIVQMINGIYPTDYQNLEGVAPTTYPGDHFWASLERTEGDEYIELDLGTPQALNYVSFEVSRKGIQIDVDFDVLDAAPARRFIPATPSNSRPAQTVISFSLQDQNPWVPIEINFTDALGEMIYSRFLRLRFSRLNGIGSPFVDPNTGTLTPWSIEVRNLRVGRYVA